MKIIGILLIILGAIGIFLSAFMYGSIAEAALIGALAALISGIGFLICNKKMNEK